VDHFTYAICGDGDLMEGLSHEAFSLAGHLELNRLIVFYDSNGITIEGKTALAYSDDVKRRFLGYRWNVLEIDAHDYEAIDKAIRRARRESRRPTLVICHSHIGKGSPNKQDTADAHGAPLGADEVRATKRLLGLPEDQVFHVPPRVYEIFRTRTEEMERTARRWQKRFKAYTREEPDRAALWNTCMSDAIPDDLLEKLPAFDPAKSIATRSASGTVLQTLADLVPQLVGGAADLAPSTRTYLEKLDAVSPGHYAGRNLHFGVREHAMCAILNGMSLHGGVRPFGATFFVFLDYCRPSVRLAAIMKLPVIYVFTHDSFYVGEDGPTHEPVEHIASLRCMPNMTVFRPSDPTETAAAWVAALKHRGGPSALLLTRQNVPVIDRSKYPSAANLEKGAYVLWENRPAGIPDLILIASGSEVDLALRAATELAAECAVRVVSMPSWELFETQSESYRRAVLPPECRKRLAIEAASSFGWSRYVGEAGTVIGLDRFGASAPYKTLSEQFGFTVPNVVGAARKLLASAR
jgi:transketolase